MEKERRISAPEGCEIEKVELVDGVAVVTFKEKERKLPKSWEEFCNMYPVYTGEYYIIPDNSEKIGQIMKMPEGKKRTSQNAEVLPDRATAEAVLALCQLIQLRNAYNGDWMPDWTNNKPKYVTQLNGCEFAIHEWHSLASSPLYFKSAELCDEFLRNFRQLIEKLKPLYGIKEGGGR